MPKFENVSYQDLVLQGLSIEQKIYENVTEPEEEIKSEKTDLTPVTYSLGIGSELYFKSMKDLVDYYYEDNKLTILPISKFEFIGDMDYMYNVVKEETIDGIVRYYSYIDKDHYYVFSLAEAIANKICQWTQMCGDITRLYESLQKQGATINFEDEPMSLSLHK